MDSNLKYKLVTDGGLDMYGGTPSQIYNVSDVSIGDSLTYISDLTIGISIAIAVVLLSFAGIAKVLEQFGVKDVKIGKSSIDLWNPIVGLIIILSSWVVLNTLNPDLLRFPIFSNSGFDTPIKKGGGSSPVLDSVGPIPTSDGVPLYTPGA